jgi:hypothetical protein
MTEPTNDKLPRLWIDPPPFAQSPDQFWRDQGVLPAEDENEDDEESGEEEGR